MSEKLFHVQATKRQKYDWEKWEKPDPRTSWDQTRPPDLHGRYNRGHSWGSRGRELKRDTFVKVERARQGGEDDPCEITIDEDLPVLYANRRRYRATGAYSVAPRRLVNPYSAVSWEPMLDTQSGVRYSKVTREGAFHSFPSPSPHLHFPLTLREAAYLRGSQSCHSVTPGRLLHSGLPAPACPGLCIPGVSLRKERGTTARITHLCP